MPQKSRDAWGHSRAMPPSDLEAEVRGGQEAGGRLWFPATHPPRISKPLPIWNAESDLQGSDGYKGTGFCQVTLFDRNGP